MLEGPDDDEDIKLSSHAQAALAEFLAEKKASEEEYEELQRKQDRNGIEIGMFKEDWQLSQFWYDDETATSLAEQLIKNATRDTTIAIISAPSVYSKLKTINVPTGNIYLFEFDLRFEHLPHSPHTFVPYDYKSPLRFPTHLKSSIHRILVDPPFLSEECLTCTAVTVRALQNLDEGLKKTILCTGRKMESWVAKLFPGMKRVGFVPQHGGGLSNEFGCFADFESEEPFKWVEDE